jgi:benzoyl-CoA reductase/2-hydroxyglutaryl-CoA dehydratase subunit BcrC/BadD/HgdB
MLKMMLSEMKRQATEAFSEKADARALWFAEWAKLFLAAYETERPVVYTSFYAFPMEILHSCDVAPFDFELGSSMLLSLDLGVDLLGEAEDRGYSPDICSFHRASLASYYRDYFPKPDLLISTSFYCGGKARTSQILSDLYRRPSLLLDVPNEVSRESVHYVVGQLREAAGKVAALTGTPFDEDRLREAVGHSNRARTSHLALLDLLKHRPAPWGGSQLVNYSIFSRMFDGSPVLSDIHEAFTDKLQRRIETGTLRPERHRVFWYAWLPTYKNTVFDTLTQNGVSVPVCETFLVHADEIDEKNPFEGLALRCLRDPFVGRTNRRTDILDTVVDEFGIDGAILFATPACRHSKGNSAIMKEALRARGVPLLVLDMDIADPRAYGEEQTRTRLEGFIELLDDKRYA